MRLLRHVLIIVSLALVAPTLAPRLAPPILQATTAAATVIGSSSAGASSSGAAVTTAAFDTTGANLIVLISTNNSANPTAAVQDSASNTWTATTRRSNGGGAVQVFYVYNPTTSTSHTATIPALAGNLASLTMIAVANAQASPFDQEAGSTSATTGSITPTQNGELVVVGVTDSAMFSYTTNGDQLGAGMWSVVGGNRFSHFAGFFVQATAAAVSRTIGAGCCTNAASTIVSFKLGTVPSGGGGASAYTFIK